MSSTTRDASYVAYLTRENAWLRAQLARVLSQHEELRRPEGTRLEARSRDTLAAREVDGT